jgi:hypothetical protein
MTAGYARVFRRIWRDEKFRTLSRDEKLAVLYLLSGQSNRIGYFAFSLALAAEDLGLDLDECRACIARGCAQLGWEYDASSGVILVPTWWKWNHPTSYDALTGYLTDLRDVPRSPLFARFVKCATALRSAYRPVFMKAIRHAERAVAQAVE